MPYDPLRDTVPYRYDADDPARRAVAVTPSNDTDLAVYAKALWIGTGGDLSVIPTGNADAQAVTFKVPAGVFPVQVRRVRATGTTAEDIVALY